jgi:hypothetical protein
MQDCRRYKLYTSTSAIDLDSESDLFIPPRHPSLSRPPLHLQISALVVDNGKERVIVKQNSVGTFGWFEIWRFLSACCMLVTLE